MAGFGGGCHWSAKPDRLQSALKPPLIPFENSVICCLPPPAPERVETDAKRFFCA
jgi:hypothetical protein